VKKHFLIYFLALTMAFVVTTGCDDDDDNDSGSDIDVDAGGDADADADADGDADPAFSSPDDVVGTWALRNHFKGSGKMKITGFGPVVAGVVSDLHMVLNVTASADGYAATSRICDMTTDLKPGAGVTAKIILPDAFFSGMVDQARPITVAADGSLDMAEYIELMGLDEANFDKASDPMPEQMSGDAAGAALLDQDGDGDIGITAHMKASAFGLKLDADLFTVERATITTTGAFDDLDHASGTVAWSLEMIILGVKQDNMGAIADRLGAPELTPAEDATKSTFRMARIADGATCAEVNAQADTLFADGPFAL
jgi:hypothetical protein